LFRIRSFWSSYVIANLHAENKVFDQSLLLYEEIVVTDIPLKEYEIFKTKVYYNYAKTLYAVERFNRGLEIAEDGIRLAAELESMSMLGQLYFQKGVCQEELNYPIEETAESYEKALMIFGILDKQDYAEETKERMLCLKV
jgi:predicted DNA-binding protein (UPF0278 family)